jgi:ribosomal-protein-serine acetyltransferase
MIEASIFYRPMPGGYFLKLLEPTDAAALFTTIEANKTELSQWLPWVESTRSVTDSRTFIEESLRKHKRNENMITGIWHGQKLIGCIGFNEINVHARKAAIGYWLARNYRGKGIITEACRILIAYGFDELRLHKIEILCADQNLKSRAVPQRLQFKEEGTLRNYLRLHDQFVSIIIYSLSRRDWHASNN